MPSRGEFPSVERVEDEYVPLISEIAQALARDILSLPELAHPGWDSYAMVAEVTDDSVAATAYRYPPSGPPLSTEPPEDDELLWDLRDGMRGPDGRTWEVAIVKIHRETAGLVIDFKSGADADPWRVTPANIEHLPESLRPRADEFDAA